MERIAVVGLGYVGLSLAHYLANHLAVTGFDISSQRVAELRKHHDRNNILTNKELKNSALKLSSNQSDIEDANFYIITVPTPAYYYENPNLEAVIEASKLVASLLKKGDMVAYETTGYPGMTEEVCIKILEEHSHLSSGKDFYVGYSPERVNPGDKVHTLQNTPKIISAQNNNALKRIMEIYSFVCDHIIPVSSIKTAEAIKILENTQRDVNIAFMNEFCKIMHALNINTHEILEGAKTKWNFCPFKPGLVGGHCIAVDPYYLTFKAKRHAVEPKLILAARQINNDMSLFIVNQMNKIIIKERINTDELNVGVFGITYKENVPDIRSSLSLKLIKELSEEGIKCIVNDPLAVARIVEENYGISLKNFDEISHLHVAVLVVQHDFYKEKGFECFLGKLNTKAVIMDIPHMFVKEKKEYPGLIYWGL